MVIHYHIQNHPLDCGEGKEEDYLPLHNKMDCSKKYFSDNRDRTLEIQYVFIFEVMIPIFGEYITNSGRKSCICKRYL